MLVLARNYGESIRIGRDIRITVVELRQGSVRIGIDAPLEIPVHREEVYLEIEREKQLQSRECEFCGDPATKVEMFDREVFVCDQCHAK